MPDIFHQFGQDLAHSPTGDLLTVDGGTLGVQRIYRRLATPGGSYIWHPGYGAGLPGRIGDPLFINSLASLIRGQIFEEAAVAQNPPPVTTVTETQPGSGQVSILINYKDAQTGEQSSLAFDPAS
jgi:hypothetical protein